MLLVMFFKMDIESEVIENFYYKYIPVWSFKEFKKVIEIRISNFFEMAVWNAVSISIIS